MKWFKHDTDATSDAKIRKLVLRHGAIGYAVYFHCLELIAGSVSDSNLTFELEHDSEIIADNLKIRGTSEQAGVEIVQDVMRYIVELGLFQESEHKIFCFKLLKRLDSSMTSNKKMREIIGKAKESHDGVMMESCRSHDGVMLEEKRREEKRLDKKRKEPSSRKVFSKPSVEDISAYCKTRNNGIKPEKFFDHYEAKGWKIGSSPMKDWKAAVRTWEGRQLADQPAKGIRQTTFSTTDYGQTDVGEI